MCTNLTNELGQHLVGISSTNGYTMGCHGGRPILRPTVNHKPLGQASHYPAW